MTPNLTVSGLKANTSQKQLMACKKKFALWIGGPAGGKTTGAVDWVMRAVVQNPGIWLPICRLHHNSLPTTTRADFEARIPSHLYKANNQWDYWTFWNQSRVYWLGLDAFESREGMNIGGFVVDQAEELDQRHVDFLERRLRQIGMPLQGVFLANAVDFERQATHWMHTFAMVDDRFEIIRGGIEQNQMNLPPDYVKSMIEGRSEEWIKRHVLGESTPGSESPPCYPDYREYMRLQEDVGPVDGVIHEGIDGGPTDNFFACMWWQRQNMRVVTLAELVTEMLGATQFGERILAFRDQFFSGGQFTTRGDPPLFTEAKTDNRSSATILRRMGVMVKPGESGMQPRKSAVRDLLGRVVDGKPMLQVNPRCQEFHRAMLGEYHMRLGDEGKFNEPVKNRASHIVEAFETSYAVSVDIEGRQARYLETKQKMRTLRPTLWGGMR